MTEVEKRNLLMNLAVAIRKISSPKIAEGQDFDQTAVTDFFER